MRLQDPSSTSDVRASRTFVPALDGVRGLAILLVMMIHLRVPLGGGPAIDQFVWAWTGAGWLGVDLFFVLSGFLITGILWDARGGPTYFRSFYGRRALRIIPVYYLVLILLFVVAPRIGAPLDLGTVGGREWSFWLFLSNMTIALQGWPDWSLQVVWSLAVEEQFYLVWPILVLLARRRVQLLAVCAGLIFLAPLVRVALIMAGNSPAAYVAMPARMDSLAMGAAIALIARGERGIEPLVCWARRLILIAGGLLINIAVLQGGPVYGGLLMETLGFTSAAFLFGGLLVLALTPRSLTGRALSCRVLRSLGTYSYALYLLHEPIHELVRRGLWDPANTPPLAGSHLPGFVLNLAILVPACFGLAWLSMRYFEGPILRLKRFLPYPSAVPFPLWAPEAVAPRVAPGPEVRGRYTRYADAAAPTRAGSPG